MLMLHIALKVLHSFVKTFTSPLLFNHIQCFCSTPFHMKTVSIQADRVTGGKLVGGASWCLRYKITMRGRKQSKRKFMNEQA